MTRMADYKDILFEIKDQVAWITINRPRILNAFREQTLDEMIDAMDAHVGTPDEVIASLRADSALARATDVAVQVHSIDPPHPFILRSIELVAGAVAPALGWGRHVGDLRPSRVTTEPKGR